MFGGDGAHGVRQSSLHRFAAEHRRDEHRASHTHRRGGHSDQILFCCRHAGDHCDCRDIVRSTADRYRAGRKFSQLFQSAAPRMASARMGRSLRWHLGRVGFVAAARRDVDLSLTYSC